MKNLLQKFGTKAAAVAMLSAFSVAANAQVYVETFDSLTNTGYGALTVTMNNGYQWNIVGTAAGTGNSDWKIGAKSARLAGTTKASSNPDTSKIEMAANKPGGIGDISFKYKVFGNDTSGANTQINWLVQWSSNGTAWTTLDTIKGKSFVQTYNRTLNQANARIRIYANGFDTSGANGKRLNIDSLALTNNAGVLTGPVITAKTPVGNNVSLQTDSLTITFSDPVTAGTGNVKLFKTGVAAPINTFTPANATITGNKVRFSPIILDNNTSYYVTVDTAAFKLNNIGNSPIAANAWTFSTVDTTPLTTLNETFTGCAPTAMGIFKSYNAVGNKFWNCSTYGRTDAAAVYINGGTANGAEKNSDWLISSKKFNFNAMAQPTLSFWHKRRFTGTTVVRKVKISTNYNGYGDPAAATWTDLTMPASFAAIDTAWKEVTGISLTAYKNKPFYLAFTYECDSASTSGAAYELTYDDIKVSNTVSVGSVRGATIEMSVLGMPTTNNIRLNVSMQNSARLDITIYDVTGRKVATRNYLAQAGDNVINVDNLNLSGGMYMVYVNTANGFGAVKAAVK